MQIVFPIHSPKKCAICAGKDQAMNPIWEMMSHQELDSELPKLANSCPDRGYKVAVFVDGLATTQVFFTRG